MQMRACLAVCRLATPMDSMLEGHLTIPTGIYFKSCFVCCVCKNCVGRRRAEEQQIRNPLPTAPVAKCQLDDDSPMSNGLSIRSSAKFS